MILVKDMYIFQSFCKTNIVIVDRQFNKNKLFGNKYQVFIELCLQIYK